MLKATSMAAAVTIVATSAFILCGLLSYLAPDLFWSVTGSWLHALSIESIRATEPMAFSTFISGIICFAAYIWVITFAATSLYNRFARSK